jgi:hypothetical protein
MEKLADIVRNEGRFKGGEQPLCLALGSDSEKDFKTRAQNIIDILDNNVMQRISRTN